LRAIAKGRIEQVRPEGPIPFIDLQAQRRRLGTALDEAIARVLEHGRYIMGPEIGELEARLAAFCGARHAISCANGTDALALGLMVKGVRPGDAVLVPSFTFVATAEVVAWLGARPLFVDVLPGSFNLDPASLEDGIASARALGLRPVGAIAVDLFGQAADYDALLPVCAAHGLWLMDDAAQAFGATYRGRRIGEICEITATSFFPAKPLGCYGDGGAVFVDDDDLAAAMRSMRIHGQGQDKYDNVRIGMNGRLDTLQAAILLQKLAIFRDEIEARQRVAAAYAEGLQDIVRVPQVIAGTTSVWAQYTVVLEEGDRDAIARHLNAAGVPSAIYYPKPLHRQTAYRHYPSASSGLPVSERLAGQVLSLPMHPYLEADLQGFIVRQLRAACGH
jgi:dTDP-4-amino-4,6-dideoxygalactose transaminase